MSLPTLPEGWAWLPWAPGQRCYRVAAGVSGDTEGIWADGAWLSMSRGSDQWPGAPWDPEARRAWARAEAESERAAARADWERRHPPPPPLTGGHDE